MAIYTYLRDESALPHDTWESYLLFDIKADGNITRDEAFTFLEAVDHVIINGHGYCISKNVSLEKTVLKIATIETINYQKSGYTSRPYGKEWLRMVTDIQSEIIDRGLAGEITEEVVDELTDWNCHTAAHACKCILSLKPYM